MVGIESAIQQARSKNCVVAAWGSITADDISPFVRSSNCRRFCSWKSTRVQQNSTWFHDQRTNDSMSITYKQQNPTNFNRLSNLVRDQGVGGSNPLSPTIIFNEINCISGFPSTSMVSKL
jgi:hypothetical protein